MRNAAVVVAGFTLVSAGLVGPAQSARNSPAGATEAEVLVAGTVKSELGTQQPAPVQGAEVYVWWIPGMETAKPGDELQIETVAKVRSGPDGSYSVKLAPTAAMNRAAAANGGWLNFDVGTVAPEIGRSQTAGISRRVSKGHWVQDGTGDAGARAALTYATAAQDSEDPSYSGAMSMEADLVISNESPEPTAPAVSDGLMAEPDVEETPTIAYCSFIVTGTPQRAVSVVEFHNAANSNGKWTYGATADSDIEFGIDHSGDGGWSAGGERHISNAEGAAVSMSYSGGDKANNYGRTDFKFVDGYYKPYGPGPYCEGSSILINTKVKNPIEWQGGVSTNTDPGSEYIGCSNSPQSTHRTSYPVGSTFTRSSSGAAQIGAAVDIGPIYVGAKSGYSTRMDMYWDSKRGNGIWLCGTNYGVTTAGVIHAQNRP